MSYKIVNLLNYKSSVYRFIFTSLPMIYSWKYKGIGLCSLVSKDSDICLQHSKNWTTLEGGRISTYLCSNATSYCDLWEKDMRRCCPETCNSTKFTKESCLNSSSEGSCVYPFRARYGDCYEHQKSMKEIKIYHFESHFI